MKLECELCGRTFRLDDFVYRCDVCDYPLNVTYHYDEIATEIDKRVIESREWSIWRYGELLPIKNAHNIISMEEGGTTLQKSCNLAESLDMENLYLKNETRNPTWSFKDRGSSVGVSKALEIRTKAVGCTSSGNMAASVAAYAAKAKMKCFILVPSSISSEKTVQILMHDAEVISISKPYPEIGKEGLKLSKDYGVYWVHADAPLRIEGQKTASYEICEQLGWGVPDKVIVPTGSGGNISAHWKGWKELNDLGFIENLPSMIAIQAEGCDPIVRAFKGKKESITPLKKPQTVAQSISNPDPPSGQRVLKLLQESDGLAETVSDKEILDAQRLLAKTEGLFAEPAGAAPVAYLRKAIGRGVIGKDEKIVCIITGSGLKDVKSAKWISHKLLKLRSLDCLKTVFHEVS